MRYLNNDHIRDIGIDWPRLADLIESTLLLLDTPEVVQPLKPYLRFRHPGNRIIAMPSFVGGSTDISGIKWIASFPGNVAQGKPRAHSTIILNDPADGVPVAILNSGLLSELRTAAVSAVMLRPFFALRRLSRYRVGMIGWGPIGRRQLEMVLAMFGDKVDSIRLHDVRGIDPATLDPQWRVMSVVASDWQEVYRHSDIVFTCTSSTERYIDEPPLPGSLLMNISLREYTPQNVRSVKAIVVDNWQEVCRENTDIEQLHTQAGLTERDTVSLRNVVYERALEVAAPSEPIFFNPMGMAAFDMTLAAYYWREAERLGIGVLLDG
ncbi:2,3-diaminopropionate biosynthesis protein SbnB [Cohnella mopanensis]|uniref:2,3-diaminopropionate biosynthesis protein SbnB n=1 Tax=Cohnella mopanensis TaxID=2911966 RepID=UPI001EF96253|nr:2,3-diaminopropionate biosynthesis protein SbnB [Cohnella mopanensis]